MHSRLAQSVLREARVQAYKSPLLNARELIHGGLVLGEADSALRHWRHGAPADWQDPQAEYTARISGAFSYAGFVYRHFGHFLAEMVHRIVPSRLQRPYSPFVFVGPSGSAKPIVFEKLPTVPRTVLGLLGLGPDDCRFVTKHTTVEELLAVEQGSALGTGPKPGYLDDLHEYVTPRLDALHRWDSRPKKVYVSRSRMRGGLFLGERYLEEQLSNEGFAIVNPETLPISEQMDLYRKSEILIFAEGSACHGIELLGTGALRRCYLLVRRPLNLSNFQAILQPRAAEFEVSLGHPYVGTKFLQRHSQVPIIRQGVSLFNPNTLVEFFRNNSIARLPLFCESRYYDAAEVDLLTYIAGNSIDLLHLREPKALQKLVTRFHRAKADLAACGNADSPDPTEVLDIAR